MASARQFKLEKILVGYDGGDRAHEALELALLLARAGAGRVIVTCVYWFLPLNASIRRGGTAPLTRDDAEVVARELEDSYGADVDVRLMMSPSAARALRSVAYDEQVDLIVVGSTSRGRVGRAVPGTTADRLLRSTGIPVAVPPRDYLAPDALTHLGAAFCTEPLTLHALDVAVAIARSAGAAVNVIGAFDGATVERTSFGRFGAAETTVNMRESAEADLEDAVRELDSAAVPVSTALIDGEPASVLVEQAEHLDLLVLDSRARATFGRVALGSVSHSTLTHSPSPVLLVPRDYTPDPSERNPLGVRRVHHL